MKKLFKILLIAALAMPVTQVAHAQCAMCQEVADESTKNGNTAGDGVNKGVLYLFLSPYLIVGTIGFILWRSRRQAQQEIALEANP